LDVARVVRDELAEGGVALAAERLVEARDRAGRMPHLAHVLGRQPGLLRHLVVRRRPLQLQGQLALRTCDLLLALDDVYRDADRARLVRDAALDRLPDPPPRVCRDLVTAPP